MPAVLVGAFEVLFETATRDVDNVVVEAEAVRDTELTSTVTVVLADMLVEPLALAVVRPLMLK